ncbi:hypothetical protein GmHk_07G019178 [Glycine max]|nr:hypothetical protein GmHk_07G019178 [Glycine max]
MRERERHRERERVRRERNIGRGRDTLRGKRVWRERVSFGEASRRSYAGNTGRVALTHTVTNWRDHKDITSLYFSRFADDITEKELWYHFKRWGDVREIFIPKRRNLAGRRYGFVRFKGVQDIPYLVRKLDSIVIGGLKLFVNLPKYGREIRRETAGTIQTKGVVRNRHSTPTSYADALRRNINCVGDQKTSFTPTKQNTSSSVVHIEVKPEDTLWLKEAWVARLKNPALFERMEEELLWEAGMDVNPTFLGDDQVLLLGLSENDAHQLINGGRTLLFSSTERWRPNIRVDYRLTWIQCWGIPVQAWNPKHINQIVAVMGEMVDLDDSVEEKRRLDKARVLIWTQWRPLIQHTMQVMIDDDKFTVHIIEESCQGHLDCLRRRGNVGGSSEEINSDDTMLDSSSHINWDPGDNVSNLPELESCSNLHGVVPQNSVGAEEQGGPTRPCPSASELRSARQGEVATSSQSTEVQDTGYLPAGYKEGRDPLDTYPQSIPETCVTPLPGQNFKSSFQAMETNTERRQQVSLCARNVEAKEHHQNGNGGNGRSRGVIYGQKESHAEDRHVALAEDRTDTCDKSKYSELEGHITDKTPRTAHNGEHIPIYTPKEKNYLLGLQTQEGLDGNLWQVYSKKRRCQKQPNTGFLPSNSRSTAIIGDTQQQHNDNSTQLEAIHKDILQQ